MAVPADVEADDIVLLICGIDHLDADFQTADWPEGFEELQEANLTLDGHSAALGWKRLTEADAGSYTFGNLGQSGDWICQAAAFSGRHASDPPVATVNTNNDNNTNPVTVTANGVTAVEGDDLLWGSAPDVTLNNVGNGHTPPTDFTERQDAENQWANLSIATRDNVSAGATGSVSGTFAITGNGAGWAAFLVRIPVAEAGTPGGYWLQEDGFRWVLEDGSGFWVQEGTESAPPVELDSIATGRSAAGSVLQLTVGLSSRAAGAGSTRAGVNVAQAIASRASGAARTMAQSSIARALSVNATGRTATRAGANVARSLTTNAAGSARTLASAAIARALSVRSAGQSLALSVIEAGGSIAARVMAGARVVGSLVMARSLDAAVGGRSATRAGQNVALALSAISGGGAAVKASASVARALVARLASVASARVEQTASRALSAVIRTGASVRATLPPLFEEVVGIVRTLLRGSMRRQEVKAPAGRTLITASAQISKPITASGQTRTLITASARIRIPIVVRAVNMIAKNVTLKGYVIGDDTEIAFQLTDWPAGVLLAKAYFTMKKSLKDADAAAIIQREITLSLTAEGQITANGSTGTAEGYFLIRHQDAEWANVKPDLDYFFDIQPITDQATVQTPIVGTISFIKGRTDAAS